MTVRKAIQEWRDRRRGYSFKGHLKRLRDSGRLPQIAWGSAVMVIIAGTSLARCQSEGITGPAERPSATAPQPSATVTSTGTVSQNKLTGPKSALAVFPTSLLPSIHPCLPDLTFVEMSGDNSITYYDEVVYNSDGSRHHNVYFDSNEKQQGKDKNGKAYRGGNAQCPDGSSQSTQHSNCFVKMNPNGNATLVTHFTVKPEEDNSQTCTTTTGDGGTMGGNSCPPFDTGPTYTFALLEDPVTHEGTLQVTVASVSASCPLTTTAMAGEGSAIGG